MTDGDVDTVTPPWASVSYPRVLLAVLSAILIAAFLVGASTSGAAFGAYNSAWDGASDLRSQAADAGLDSDVVRSTEAYGETQPNETVAVILSPDRAYTAAEAARVEQFVRKGGTLVVGEDFGPHSNALLSELGAATRVDGRLLRDERNNYQSPSIPVATNVSNATGLEGVADEGLTLDYGTVLEPDGARVPVSSSPYGYLDTNRNDALDDNETLASYPVVTSEQIGEGRVVVVSDASFGINAMTERPGNRAFLASLFAGHERALLDYSHAERLPPLRVGLLVFQDSPVLQLGVGLLLVTALAVGTGTTTLRRVRRRLSTGDTDPKTDVSETVSRTELVDYLSNEHPDWNSERLERVVDAVLDDRD